MRGDVHASRRTASTVGSEPEETTRDFNTLQYQLPIPHTSILVYLEHDVCTLSANRGGIIFSCPRGTRRGIKHVHGAYSLQKRVNSLTANEKHV